MYLGAGEQFSALPSVLKIIFSKLEKESEVLPTLRNEGIMKTNQQKVDR